jgi:hypothetical protein
MKPTRIASARIFLRFEAVFDLRIVDDWIHPIDFVPDIGMDGDLCDPERRLWSVNVAAFHTEVEAAKNLIFSEELYADPPPWDSAEGSSHFLTREIRNHSTPAYGFAEIDLSELASINITDGELTLNGQIFSEWDHGSAEPGFDPEIRWYLNGDFIPEMSWDFFCPPYGVPHREWQILLQDAQFVRHHTQSPWAWHNIAHALSNREEFIDWLAGLPEERIRQLPVLPATMNWIREQRHRSGRNE